MTLIGEEKRIAIVDDLVGIYYPLMRAMIKEGGTYEEGRDAGLFGVYKHLTGSGPRDMEVLISTYSQAYDDFAGPVQFRHTVNMDHYHRAGLLGVYQEIEETT